MKIITLTTDFGLKDGNVAILKGEIWKIAPDVQIVDISHLVQAQNTFEAALILYHAVHSFPPHSIHVYVIDPGVGTKRRCIAAEIGNQYFIGPDNGILTLLIESARNSKLPQRFVNLDNNKYWLSEISNVFHGRDIFSPVAAHLANGTDFSRLGSELKKIVTLQFPIPKKINKGWEGQVIYIDHFGNIATNLLQKNLPKSPDKTTVEINRIQINGISKTFGDKDPGAIVALLGGPNNLILSMVNGNASQKIHAKIGDRVRIIHK